jgi:PAS domain S-box-containing protein
MNITFKRKILIGYIINLLVILALGFIYWNRMIHTITSFVDWVVLFLIIASLIMLTVIYFIIRAQLRAKNKSEIQLLENEKLLQSIINNSSNPISVKKINGEYIWINKQYESLFQAKEENIIGKTDHDFLPKETADQYRSSDLEAVKLGQEIQVEEIIEQPDGPHTYLAVKFPLFDVSSRVYAIGTIATDISERKAIEKSLVAGDTFFKMSWDMLIIASENTFKKVNPATLKILGYNEEELLGKPFMDFIYPDDIDATLREVAKLQSGEITVNFENRYICKDGSLKWLNWTTYPDLKTGLLYAVARDVTNNKTYEESLKAADNFFKLSYDILVIASRKEFVKINPALSKILGYSELELKSKPFSNFILPEDLAATEKELEKLQKGMPMVNFRNRWVCKDGDIKWLSWTAISDADTGLLYAIARDITERLKLEEEEQAALDELYENEQKLTLILENISDGVLVSDEDGNVVLANNMVNEMFGIEDDTKISGNFSDQFELYFPDEKTVFPVQKLPLERALAGEATDDIDVVLWNPALQQKRRVLLSGRSIVNHQNKVIAAVITIKDISQYKKMEKDLKKTELKYRRLIGFKKGDENEEQESNQKTEKNPENENKDKT